MEWVWFISDLYHMSSPVQFQAKASSSVCKATSARSTSLPYIKVSGPMAHHFWTRCDILLFLSLETNPDDYTGERYDALFIPLPRVMYVVKL